MKKNRTTPILCFGHRLWWLVKVEHRRAAEDGLRAPFDGRPGVPNAKCFQIGKATMKLEWREGEEERRMGWWVPVYHADVPGADSPGRNYYKVFETFDDGGVKKTGGQKWWCSLVTNGDFEKIGTFDTIDEAKAAAESHYAQSQP